MPSAKPVLAVHRPGSTHWVGDGFRVHNLFPSNKLGEALSPFLLLDFGAAAHFPPTEKPRGVGEHPHRGFETVTVAFQGKIAHRDSAGNSGIIGPGDVQWMTAGSGVVHEEFHEREWARAGGTLEMVQLWVNLPRAHKRTAPRYQDLRDAAIPRVERPGALVRVIAGEQLGARGPARTFSEVELCTLELAAGATLSLELPAGHTAALFVLSGEAAVNASAAARATELVVLGTDGTAIDVRAAEPTRALVLGGRPLGEPVAMGGPFVMNTRAELLAAMRDYQDGRMGHLADRT
jgi:redox-sensitive bicupin YhaK (pirin superfamily)